VLSTTRDHKGGDHRVKGGVVGGKAHNQQCHQQSDGDQQMNIPEHVFPQRDPFLFNALDIVLAGFEMNRDKDHAKIAE